MTASPPNTARFIPAEKCLAVEENDDAAQLGVGVDALNDGWLLAPEWADHAF